MKNKTELSIINLSSYTAPVVKEKAGTDWVEFGANNGYFGYLIDRFNGSPTNRAIINGISEMIFGKGLDATDSHRRPEQYAQMISLFQDKVVRRLASDLKLMGQCAIQVIYSKNRAKIVKLEHIPIETLRAEKCNEKGEIPAYYYSNDWSKYKRSMELKRIPAFGMSKEGLEILYIKPYRAGYKYYSPPDYTTQYAELEEEISNYHLNNILNGLAPSMLINMNNGTPDPEQRELIEQRIYQKFSGSSNAGKFILAFNDDPSAAATIDPIQLSEAHQQYQFLSDESSKKIMVGHRVVSPMLFGIKDSTGLGNNADELKTASILFDNMVIKGFQTLLINGFDQILAYNDISLHLYFKTLQPLEFTDLTNVTDQETREEETGVKLSEDKELSEEQELSNEDSKNILGSLAESGVEMSEDYVFVDEMNADDDIDNESWANYLIKEKKSGLSKDNELVGLKDYVTSYKKGNAFSVLDSPNGLYKIRYKYAIGSTKKSSSQREFCRNMMNMAKTNIVWRIEDIDKATDEGVNKQLGHNRKPYNLFRFKGGIYCRHIFKKILYRLKANTEESNNLADYKTTRTIPAKYNRKTRGSKDAAKAPVNMPNKGAYPK